MNYKEIAEEASRRVLEAHRITDEEATNTLDALSWALGQSLNYEEGLVAFAEAVAEIVEAAQ